MATDEVIAAHPPSEHFPSPPIPTGVHVRHRKVQPVAFVAAFYLVLGVVAFWPVVPGISTNVFSAEGDFSQSVWFLAWVPHALAHGLNPFFSNALLVPNGVNLAENTASPLLGLITAPFASLFNPVVRANLLIVLGMPISAMAGFVVLRKWKVWAPAAAVGGLVYGFSPYMVGQAFAHVEFVFVPLPPFIALVMASIVQGRGSPGRLGAILGLLIAGQYLISPELLTTIVMLTFLMLACMAGRHPTRAVQLARTLMVPLGIALAVSAVLLAYPLWMLISGPQHFTGATFPVLNPYHNDLSSFVAPGSLQRVPFALHLPGALTPGPTEAGGYIGVLLLLESVFLAWRSRHTARMRLAVLLLLVAAIFSLGPYLSVDGRLTNLPLPFWLVDHIPFFDNVLPVRISFEMQASLAAIIAFGLDDLQRLPGALPQHRSAHHHVRPAGSVFVAVTLAVLFVTQFPLWPYPRRVDAALPNPVERAVPSGDPVTVTYPYDTGFLTESMLWQVQDNFRFRLMGGYAYHRDSDGGPSDLPSLMNPPDLQHFLAAQEKVDIYGPPLSVDAELVSATRVYLSKFDVRMVIVKDFSGSRPVMTLFSEALGPPRLLSDGFAVWTRRSNSWSR